jgi:cation diffusion facilitator CzcD-associated flavoprotein CzcO
MLNHLSARRPAVEAVAIGGGVCGPVTAMALQRAGIEAAAYEAH